MSGWLYVKFPFQVTIVDDGVLIEFVDIMDNSSSILDKKSMISLDVHTEGMSSFAHQYFC